MSNTALNNDSHRNPCKYSTLMRLQFVKLRVDIRKKLQFLQHITFKRASNSIYSFNFVSAFCIFLAQYVKLLFLACKINTLYVTKQCSLNQFCSHFSRTILLVAYFRSGTLFFFLYIYIYNDVEMSPTAHNSYWTLAFSVKNCDSLGGTPEGVERHHVTA
jgi:hypothetical protein